MNTKNLRPALLHGGDIYWIAWDITGKPVLFMPLGTNYLKVQGLLENIGFCDVPLNSKTAESIRNKVEQRHNNW